MNEQEHDMSSYQDLMEQYENLSPDERVAVTRAAQQDHLDAQEDQEGWVRWEAATNGVRNRAICGAMQNYLNEQAKEVELIRIDVDLENKSIIFHWSDKSYSSALYSEIGPTIHAWFQDRKNIGGDEPTDDDVLYGGFDRDQVNARAESLWAKDSSTPWEQADGPAQISHIQRAVGELGREHLAAQARCENIGIPFVEPEVIEEAALVHEEALRAGLVDAADWDDLGISTQRGYIAQARKRVRARRKQLIDVPQWAAAQKQVEERARAIYDAEATEGDATWGTLAGHQQSRWIQRAMSELYPQPDRIKRPDQRPMGRHQKMALEALETHEELEGYDAQLSAKWAAVHASLAVVEETRELHQTMQHMTVMLEKFAQPAKVVDMAEPNRVTMMSHHNMGGTLGIARDIVSRTAATQAARRTVE